MPVQVPNTQERGKFAASIGHAKYKRLSASGGLRPPDAPPGPRWGLCPQTPVIGSRSALAMCLGLSPPNLFLVTSLCMAMLTPSADLYLQELGAGHECT